MLLKLAFIMRVLGLILLPDIEEGVGPREASAEKTAIKGKHMLLKIHHFLLKEVDFMYKLFGLWCEMSMTG